MERRRGSDREATSPAAAAAPPQSPFLRDVSNYKTPRPHFLNPNPNHPSPVPIFFTASQKTPSSTAIRHRSSASRSKAARRLKALEIDQSQSSRKVQLRRQKALKAFSDSLTAWLNYLFKNPSSCGCGVISQPQSQPDRTSPLASGKRESLDGAGSVGVAGGRWRSPKRQRRFLRRGPLAEGAKRAPVLAELKTSLREVCSLEDVRERMEAYMSRKSCDEVLSMMAHICKNVDDGRLKMKAHCPIVTDLRLKEKAITVLLCYNPIWLQIGLHIVLGGDSLLLNKLLSGEDNPFLKMIVEKQFFSHMDLAKSYAYNKLVEGIYRPGYYEALGSIILKRFLLLVISLDKAKCDGTLSIKYGIDGLDGGSPLLFCSQSSIKSSRQLIHEFLSEVMHGEGDLLAHLVTVGCKVNHQQSLLAEYDFSVTNLCEDIQDGLLLCRAIQLLQSDASILSKLVSPSDTRKKYLQNCGIALQYLKQAGVPLFDADGVIIVAEDVANGDRELTLSILWNMFLHMQVPLLIDKDSLVKEIIRMRGSDLDLSKYNTMTHMALLLEWVQVACRRHHIKVDSLSSLTDGRALHHLISYYIRKDSIEQLHNANHEDLISRDDNDIDVHGFSLVKSVIASLGNFPEVLPTSAILDQEGSSDGRSLIIFLAFLAYELIQRKKMDQLISFRSRVPSHGNSDTRRSPLLTNNLFEKQAGGKNALELLSPLKLDKSYNDKTEEWAAVVVQTRFRQFSARNKFLKIKTATCLLQTVTRSWLSVNLKSRPIISNVSCLVRPSALGLHDRYLNFIFERHAFLKIKKSVILVQRLIRTWIARRHYKGFVYAATTLQSYIRGDNVRSRYLAPLHKLGDTSDEHEAFNIQICSATKIQFAWRQYMHNLCLQKWSAALTIQRHWRGWCARKRFLCKVGAIIEIQAGIQCLLHQNRFKRCETAAIEIQRFIRGAIARNRLLGSSSFQSCNSLFRCYDLINIGGIENCELRIVMDSILKLQRRWRQFLRHKSRTTAALLIQSSIRGFNSRKDASRRKHSILIIQRWWREHLFLKSRERSALIIQAHFRGLIARRAAIRDNHRIVIIQSFWRGFLVRRASQQHLLDLHHRLENSAATVSDDMRLINRSVAALSELLNCRSVSNVRHICATLNLATDHSQKCCEILVDAGAVEILLKQFHLLNRGVPDQEVLKHVLCTLRNIVRYPHLLQGLFGTQAVSLIFQELLRSKGEGFFVACELLKKIFATQKGFEAISTLQGYVKRLNVLTHDLEKKIKLQKRMAHLGPAREDTMRRLKEAVSLLLLIKDDCR